jgi:heme/copper-type cytochrome/quinol oxidase subunit 3
MVEALAAVERGDQHRLKMFLLATLLLGSLFLSIQGYEYIKLYEEGLSPTSAPHEAPAVYGTTFYLQTGFHGAHVTGGVVAMLYLTLRAFRGGFSQENHEAVELVGLYWHFVDVVWILLFTIVYLF